jgi:3-deoxy-7-phosphoheptulonate synthase
MSRVSDTRIAGYEPLVSPAALLYELKLTEPQQQAVERTRAEVQAVLDGVDDRLLVVTGPCSVHDPRAALEYAARLAGLRARFADDLLIVMRVYFEKPRTVTGWKGLINDPGMDGSYDVHRGLRTARRLLLDIVSAGLPVGCEWLDPITPQYIADAVTWGAIGARTTESQVHRQLASGLSMPVGFKNGTDGDVQVAVDALRASAASHTFFGVTEAGAAAVVTTTGNTDTHVILRGGRSGPNYSSSDVTKALDLISAAGLPRRIMVDASHGNSGKDYRRQTAVAESLAGQLAGGETGLVGVMLESFLVAGRQDPGDPATLTYGQSVTDGCLDIEMTEAALDTLAASVAARRRAVTP